MLSALRALRILLLSLSSILRTTVVGPERKKAAAVKKEAVLLQRLADTGDDGEDLWQWAWQQSASRIVVKRPARATALGTQSPSHSLTGKSVRFDVYVRPSSAVDGQE